MWVYLLKFYDITFLCNSWFYTNLAILPYLLLKLTFFHCAIDSDSDVKYRYFAQSSTLPPSPKTRQRTCDASHGGDNRLKSGDPSASMLPIPRCTCYILYYVQYARNIENRQKWSVVARRATNLKMNSDSEPINIDENFAKCAPLRRRIPSTYVHL